MTAPARPAPGRPRAFQFPAVERVTLANGLTLAVARMPRLPIVTVLALVEAGAGCDPPGREGVAALAARALPEGTAALDGAALVERFEALGTSLDTAADWDAAQARFTVMPERLGEAFALFAEVVRAPVYPERDVLRRRDERVAELEQRLTEPRGLADQRFAGFLYASTSRFARSVGGTLATVPRIGVPEVRAFHAERWRPGATTLFFVGDVTTAHARALAEAHLGDWQGTAPATAPVEARAASEARRLVIVEKAEAPQSELRVGHVGVARLHPDHFAIVVMNAILGGLFSSRINLNLRERHAFTYGASSGFDWRRAAGPFVVSTAVKSEVTDRAVAEILGEIDAMRAAPPSASEVALATDYLAGVFPIRYESTDAVAGALAMATTFRLPDDWFTTYRARIQAITPAAVHAAAQAHLDPRRLLVLAVGDPSLIRAPLEGLGLGAATAVAATYDPAEGA